MEELREPGGASLNVLGAIEGRSDHGRGHRAGENRRGAFSSTGDNVPPSKTPSVAALEHQFSCPICLLLLYVTTRAFTTVLLLYPFLGFHSDLFVHRYPSPIPLRCGHTLCDACITRLRQDPEINGGRNSVRCPVCRRSNSLPPKGSKPNLLLREAMSILLPSQVDDIERRLSAQRAYKKWLTFDGRRKRKKRGGENDDVEAEGDDTDERDPNERRRVAARLNSSSGEGAVCAGLYMFAMGLVVYFVAIVALSLVSQVRNLWQEGEIIVDWKETDKTRFPCPTYNRLIIPLNFLSVPFLVCFPFYVPAR